MKTEVFVSQTTAVMRVLLWCYAHRLLYLLAVTCTAAWKVLQTAYVNGLDG